MKKQVVIGVYGPTMDFSTDKSNRWERWRPTVSICQQEDLLIDRLELIYQIPYAEKVRQLVDDIRSVSPETQINMHPVTFDNPWDFEEVFGRLHDFSRAYPFDTDREEYLVHITTGTHVLQICLFLLTESRHLPARLLQAHPPKRWDKGPGGYTIIDLDLSRYDHIASRFMEERMDDISFLKSGIDTKNEAFNALIAQIERVAVKSRHPILLTGPTGSGKSRMARRIYELKRQRGRVSGPFVELNCATLRGTAAMSALFGHKRGAFTGAIQDREGLLRKADKGTLFLDEVGELGADEQAMLLRAIEEKLFMPVGADDEVASDFELICGTNRDLGRDALAGRFRDDLLARINLWTFRMPGLADRREDIAPNMEFELDRFARLTGERATINAEARSLFLKFATSPDARWQANFRDLNAAVTRMATLAPSSRITRDEVVEEINRLKSAWDDGLDGPVAEDLVTDVMGAERAEALDRFDRVQLNDVLKVCRASASLSDAGRTLFAVSRTRKKTVNDTDRLRKYLSRFDVGWDDIVVT